MRHHVCITDSYTTRSISSIFVKLNISIVRVVSDEVMINDYKESFEVELPNFGYLLNKEEKYHMTGNNGRKEMRNSCRLAGMEYLRELINEKLEDLEKVVPYFRRAKSDVAIYADPDWFGGLYWYLDQH